MSDQEPRPILSELAERADSGAPESGLSPEAEIAASWWGDRLRGPAKLDHLGPEGDTSDNGIGIRTIMIASIAQSQARQNADLSEERIAVFEQALAEAIDHELQESPGPLGKVRVGVDYHPDQLLEGAAAAAEIKLGMTMLPWKTIMVVQEGRVQVSEGRGAALVDLYLSPEFVPTPGVDF